MRTNNKLEFFVPDKYFKNPTEEPIIGLIRFLREQEKACEFLGFNENPSKLFGFLAWTNNYVVLIDGIKYHGSVVGDIETNYYANFFVVNDEEHDYIENYLNKRVSQINEALKEK